MDLKKKFLMNYVEDSEYSRLPKTYQEVEYIESSGTQWIDTNYVVCYGDTIEYNFCPSTITSSTSQYIGGVIDASSNNYKTYIGYYSQSALYYSVSTTNYNANYTLALNNFYKCKLDLTSGSQKFYVNDTQVATSTDSGNIPNINMYIFARHNLTIYPNVDRITALKLKSFKIYTSNVKTLDLVPCYRKADNEVGLYDMVSQTFFTNQGTGTFDKGDNVYYLPNAYQEVEYIESSGTQFIDTNLIMTNGMKMSIKAMSLTTSSNPTLCGTNGGYYRLNQRSGISTMDVYYANTQYRSSITAYNEIHEYTFNDNLFYVDGTLINTFATSTFDTTPYTQVIFALRDNDASGSIIRNTSAKVYVCKIHNSSNTLVRYFKPCYRKSDNEIGLYDCVNKVFYANQGTGTFSKGDNVYYALPSEYQKVDYVESSGTQYINTNVNTSTTLKTYYKFALSSGFTFSNSAFLFGSYYGSGGESASRYSVATASQTSLRIFNNQAFTNYTIPTIQYDVPNTIEYSNGELKYNGSLIVNQTGIADYNINLYLFCRNNSNSAENFTAQKLYKCKLYDGTTPQRVFVPCYRKTDNEIGLYDIVNNTFYPNDGTGTFTKGANNYDIIG